MRAVARSGRADRRPHQLPLVAPDGMRFRIPFTRIPYHYSLTTSVMPPRGQTNTQETTFVRAASTSAGAARSPTRRILFVIASPCVSIPFPVLYTACPAATFTKKSWPASSYVHTAPFLFLNIRKAPAGEDGEPEP